MVATTLFEKHYCKRTKITEIEQNSINKCGENDVHLKVRQNMAAYPFDHLHIYQW